jgi:hypothetical protein
MLCSVCNKNTAVVFVNKLEDGKKSVEGYCYNCAKEKGINPLEALAKNANISNSELEDMTTQIESLLKDFSENMNLESLGINPEDLEAELGSSDPTGNPLGGIFGIFKQKDSSQESETESSAEHEMNSSRKSVKVDKKPKSNKNPRRLNKRRGNLLSDSFEIIRSILRHSLEESKLWDYSASKKISDRSTYIRIRQGLVPRCAIECQDIRNHCSIHHDLIRCQCLNIKIYVIHSLYIRNPNSTRYDMMPIRY